MYISGPINLAKRFEISQMLSSGSTGRSNKLARPGMKCREEGRVEETGMSSVLRMSSVVANGSCNHVLGNEVKKSSPCLVHLSLLKSAKKKVTFSCLFTVE